MHLDFWNNPIVVSAFRVRYRRGGFTSTLAPFLVVLAAVGAGLEYYQDKLHYPWARVYYPILMGLQFLGLGLMAGTATAASMRSEVANRTLDFQRMATLSPRQILLGKLLGEPATPYLMAMSTFPLAGWCVLAGGVDLEVMLLMYVNLATTMLLCGAVGLIGSTELPVRQGPGIFAFLLAWPTPIPLLVGIIRGDPWLVTIPLFGVDIPYLLLLPPVQLLMAFVCFRVMERQLISPLTPLLTKPMAYGILATIDLVVAALLFPPPGPNVLTFRGSVTIGRTDRGVEFCLIHLVASLFLIFVMTPWRETLYSWTWRFRRRRPLLIDLWWGERSDNILALATFAGIGVASLAVSVALPVPWVDPNHFVLIWSGLPDAAILTAVLILTFGTIHQWVLLVAGRLGATITFVLAFMVAFIPLAGALSKQTVWVMSFSPLMHYAYWLNLTDIPRVPPKPAFSYLVLVSVYLVMFILFWSLLRGRMRKLEAWVDFKLRMMGALPPLHHDQK